MKLNLILGPVQELGLRGSRYSIKRSLRNQLFLGEVGKDGTGFSGNAHLTCIAGGVEKEIFRMGGQEMKKELFKIVKSGVDLQLKP